MYNCICIYLQHYQGVIYDFSVALKIILFLLWLISGILLSSRHMKFCGNKVTMDNEDCNTDEKIFIFVLISTFSCSCGWVRNNDIIKYMVVLHSRD